MRSLPYIENDPKDYSMLTQPKLKINDVVIVWDEEEGGQWAQARVIDATFNRGKKCWEYSAVVEFVNAYFEKVLGSTTGATRENIEIVVKDWYFFSDDEIITPYSTKENGDSAELRVSGALFDVEYQCISIPIIDMYIVIPKQ